uniref:Octanoyl-[acyl-carrier-protein]:protein N-octanoyltransferase LIPT2, mitochondrial n=1 Tax=Aceria tosichella TaxID=561515 RepID=A0A6G1S467_9ACAR
MKPIVYVRRLGRIPYKKALDIQLVLFEDLKSHVSSITTSSTALETNQGGRFLKSSPQHRSALFRDYRSTYFEPVNSLLLLEHNPVYTVGIRSQPYGHDYVSKLQEKLKDNNLNAEFVSTNRGGLITFHGPGQLVAYPIIYLGDFKQSVPKRSVKTYVKNLENTIIDTLAMVGLKNAHTVPEYPGVWLGGGDRKIAFIGISCKRHVTMHGISINCDCDLSWFDHIVSCGIENKAITSIRQEFMVGDQFRNNSNNTGCPNLGVEHIANAFCSSFAQHFDCELREG